MDDRKIKALLSAANTGSFSKAAERNGCTQSALSQTIISIENELGCKIFTRTHSGVGLTEAGTRLLPYVEDVDIAMDRLFREAGTAVSGKKTTLRIGTFSSISKAWLPKLMKEFQKQHPSLALEIKVGADEVPMWLDSGIVDLAIIDDTRRRSFKWMPLRDDRLLAVVPPDFTFSGNRNSITFEELSNTPFIMAPLNEVKRQIEALDDFKFREEISLDCSDDSTLIAFIEQSLGVSVLPELSVRNYKGPAQVVELSPPLKRTLGIATQNIVSSNINELVTFISSAAL